MNHRLFSKWLIRIGWVSAAMLIVLLAPIYTGCGGTPYDPDAKVLRLPIRSDGPKSLDPVRGSTVYDNQMVAQIYETLVQYKYLSRPPQLEPLLLTEMPTVSEDGKTYNFKLKKNVYFHDDPCFPDGKGREMVASDVIYSWKRMADNKNQPKSWWLFEGTIKGFDEYRAEQNEAPIFDYDKPVEGMRIISDHEFEVELVQPVTRFIWVLAMFQTSVIPREAVEEYGGRFGRHPVGTGPYTMREQDWIPALSVVLFKNENYHECYYPEIPDEPYEGMERDVELGFYEHAGQRIPFADRVEIRMFRQDQPMWLKFRTKQIDYSQVPAEFYRKAFIKRTGEIRPGFEEEGIVSHHVPLLDFIFRGFNMEDELVGGYSEKSRKLRQAISLSLDLEEFNQIFYNGTNTVYDGPIPPGLPGHPEGGRAENSYRGPDLQRARKLLAEAGYPNGEGLPELKYYVSKSANNAEQKELLRRQVARIGVKLDIQMVDFSTLMEVVDNKKAQVFSFAWSSDYPDGENNLALFYGPNESPGSNHFNYKRDEYDRLYEKILSMPDSPERTEIYEQMVAMLVEDVPYIGSMGRVRSYVVNPRLKNFKPSEDFYNWIKYLDVEEQ